MEEKAVVPRLMTMCGQILRQAGAIDRDPDPEPIALPMKPGRTASCARHGPVLSHELIDELTRIPVIGGIGQTPEEAGMRQTGPVPTRVEKWLTQPRVQVIGQFTAGSPVLPLQPDDHGVGEDQYRLQQQDLLQDVLHLCID